MSLQNPKTHSSPFQQACFKYAYQIILCLCLFVFLSDGCIFASEKYGGQLVLSTTTDPRSFNPIVAKETSTTAITGYIFEGLTTVDGVTLEVKPNLAKSWVVSADGLVWTFTLREDVFWSDGVPFTADDVLFTFNDLIYNDEIPSSARDIISINGEKFKVEKIDSYTVRFTLPAQFAPFLMLMGQSILPRHKLEKLVQEGRFNFSWGIDSVPSDIVGTGAYMLQEYFPGERIVLKKNPLYWKKSKQGERLPFIDQIIFLIVQNQDTALLKFLEGELDYCSVRGMDYPYLKPKEREGQFTIYNVGAAFGSNFVIFNQNRMINPKTQKTFIPKHKLAWFTNLEFRKAIAHIIDKRRIIDILMNGLGYPQDAAMSPSAGFFYNGDVTIYDYDFKKAREILEKAGFVDRDGDGILEDKKGNDIEFNFYTNSNSVERIQIASIIRRDMERLGMKVNFLALEFNILVRKLVSTYDWDAVIIGLTGGIEPHFGKNVWSSTGQLHMWNPGQKKSPIAWERRIDEIFDQGVQELDKKKRKLLYDEWQRIVSERLPLIYTVLSANIFAIRDKFGNLNPTSYGGAFHNLEEIYIKEEFR